jgi:hypothetical protein
MQSLVNRGQLIGLRVCIVQKSCPIDGTCMVLYAQKKDLNENMRKQDWNLDGFELLWCFRFCPL